MRDRGSLLALAVLVTALTCPLTAATVFIAGGGKTLSTNGTLNFSGTVDNGSLIAFNATIAASGMDVTGPDQAQVLPNGAGTGLRLNIRDQGDNQTAWIASWTFDFASPLSGLALMGSPLGSANVSDFEDWTLSWIGAAGSATLTNAAGAFGLYSVPAGGGKLPDGSFANGTTFRWDTDDTPDEADLTLQPFRIVLPNDVTQVVLSVSVRNITGLDLQNDGLGLDFSEVESVPEPSTYLTMGLGLAGLWWCRARIS